MGPAERNERQNLTRNFVGWGRRIRTPATWSRATRPTTRRSPTNAPNLTIPTNERPSRAAERRRNATIPNSANRGLERAARAEARHLAGRRVAAVAGGAARDHERAEAGDRHAATASERFDDAPDEDVHGALGRGLRASRTLRHDCDDLGLRHHEPSPASSTSLPRPCQSGREVRT